MEVLAAVLINGFQVVLCAVAYAVYLLWTRGGDFAAERSEQAEREAELLRRTRMEIKA